MKTGEGKGSALDMGENRGTWKKRWTSNPAESGISAIKIGGQVRCASTQLWMKG